ncbi:hypothetical protein [Paraburkholderia sp. RL17-337-BIB-A]
MRTVVSVTRASSSTVYSLRGVSLAATFEAPGADGKGGGVLGMTGF